MNLPTLTDFLLARIAEDEKNARSIENAEWFHGVDSDVEPEVLALSDPKRVLAECAAKRRIIEWHTDHEDPEGDAGVCARFTLALLALPYADHVHYRDEEWRL